MAQFIMIIVSAVFINNFVVVQFLGICPFLGVSKDFKSALGMGLAVTFVMTITCLITYPIYMFVLCPLGIEFMEIIVFIFVIAALVQFVEMALQKYSPSLYAALGIYLPLITTNCAVLGAVLLAIDTYNYGLVETIVFNFFAAVGFTVAIILLSGVRERLETAKIPKFMQGFPIVLVSAALISMAFLGFAGM